MFSDREIDAVEDAVLEQYGFRTIPGFRVPHPAPPPVELQTYPVTRGRVPVP